MDAFAGLFVIVVVVLVLELDAARIVDRIERWKRER